MRLILGALIPALCLAQLGYWAQDHDAIHIWIKSYNRHSAVSISFIDDVIFVDAPSNSSENNIASYVIPLFADLNHTAPYVCELGSVRSSVRDNIPTVHCKFAKVLKVQWSKLIGYPNETMNANGMIIDVPNLYVLTPANASLILPHTSYVPPTPPTPPRPKAQLPRFGEAPPEAPPEDPYDVLNDDADAVVYLASVARSLVSAVPADLNVSGKRAAVAATPIIVHSTAAISAVLALDGVALVRAAWGWCEHTDPGAYERPLRELTKAATDALTAIAANVTRGRKGPAVAARQRGSATSAIAALAKGTLPLWLPPRPLPQDLADPARLEWLNSHALAAVRGTLVGLPAFLEGDASRALRPFASANALACAKGGGEWLALHEGVRPLKAGTTAASMAQALEPLVYSCDFAACNPASGGCLHPPACYRMTLSSASPFLAPRYTRALLAKPPKLLEPIEAGDAAAAAARPKAKRGVAAAADADGVVIESDDDAVDDDDDEDDAAGAPIDQCVTAGRGAADWLRRAGLTLAPSAAAAVRRAMVSVFVLGEVDMDEARALLALARRLRRTSQGKVTFVHLPSTHVVGAPVAGPVRRWLGSNVTYAVYGSGMAPRGGMVGRNAYGAPDITSAPHEVAAVDAAAGLHAVPLIQRMRFVDGAPTGVQVVVGCTGFTVPFVRPVQNSSAVTNVSGAVTAAILSRMVPRGLAFLSDALYTHRHTIDAVTQPHHKGYGAATLAQHPVTPPPPLPTRAFVRGRVPPRAVARVASPEALSAVTTAAAAVAAPEGATTLLAGEKAVLGPAHTAFVRVADVSGWFYNSTGAIMDMVKRAHTLSAAAPRIIAIEGGTPVVATDDVDDDALAAVVTKGNPKYNPAVEAARAAMGEAASEALDTATAMIERDRVLYNATRDPVYDKLEVPAMRTVGMLVAIVPAEVPPGAPTGLDYVRAVVGDHVFEWAFGNASTVPLIPFILNVTDPDAALVRGFNIPYGWPLATFNAQGSRSWPPAREGDVFDACDAERREYESRTRPLSALRGSLPIGVGEAVNASFWCAPRLALAILTGDHPMSRRYLWLPEAPVPIPEAYSDPLDVPQQTSIRYGNSDVPSAGSFVLSYMAHEMETEWADAFATIAAVRAHTIDDAAATLTCSDQEVALNKIAKGHVVLVPHGPPVEPTTVTTLMSLFAARQRALPTSLPARGEAPSWLLRRRIEWHEAAALAAAARAAEPPAGPSVVSADARARLPLPWTHVNVSQDGSRAFELVGAGAPYRGSHYKWARSPLENVFVASPDGPYVTPSEHQKSGAVTPSGADSANAVIAAATATDAHGDTALPTSWRVVLPRVVAAELVDLESIGKAMDRFRTAVTATNGNLPTNKTYHTYDAVTGASPWRPGVEALVVVRRSVPHYNRQLRWDAAAAADDALILGDRADLATSGRPVVCDEDVLADPATVSAAFPRGCIIETSPPSVAAAFAALGAQEATALETPPDPVVVHSARGRVAQGPTYRVAAGRAATPVGTRFNEAIPTTATRDPAVRVAGESLKAFGGDATAPRALVATGLPIPPTDSDLHSPDAVPQVYVGRGPSHDIDDITSTAVRRYSGQSLNADEIQTRYGARVDPLGDLQLALLAAGAPHIAVATIDPAVDAFDDRVLPAAAASSTVAPAAWLVLPQPPSHPNGTRISVAPATVIPYVCPQTGPTVAPPAGEVYVALNETLRFIAERVPGLTVTNIAKAVAAIRAIRTAEGALWRAAISRGRDRRVASLAAFARDDASVDDEDVVVFTTPSAVSGKSFTIPRQWARVKDFDKTPTKAQAASKLSYLPSRLADVSWSAFDADGVFVSSSATGARSSKWTEALTHLGRPMDPSFRSRYGVVVTPIAVDMVTPAARAVGHHLVVPACVHAALPGAPVGAEIWVRCSTTASREGAPGGTLGGSSLGDSFAFVSTKDVYYRVVVHGFMSDRAEDNEETIEVPDTPKAQSEDADIIIDDASVVPAARRAAAGRTAPVQTVAAATDAEVEQAVAGAVGIQGIGKLQIAELAHMDGRRRANEIAVQLGIVMEEADWISPEEVAAQVAAMKKPTDKPTGESKPPIEEEDEL